MVFNSYIFLLVLLPICLLGYFGLNYFQKHTLAKVFLIGISLWFYAYFHVSYILLILFSIAVNYCSYTISLSINQKAYKKLICGITVFINLSILFVFKYFDFFIANVNHIFKSDLPLLHILLPLGISFFTFQQIAFTVDAYKGTAFYPNTNEKYSLIDYSLFVCFFPQLVAGPIVNHDELIPQFTDKSKKIFNYENFSKGFYAFTLGLSKKVLLADVLALAVDYGYSICDELNTPSAIFIMIAYTLELYFDFSGYSDMARGLGLMMNIELPLNFDSPFKTSNIADLWNHWHITLSRFFTRYIYIPLGGNRKGAVRTYINVFFIFFLSGLWHGADWTFVIWGVINGIGVIAVRMIKKLTAPKNLSLNKITRIPFVLINFLYFSYSFIYFRAASFSEARTFINAIKALNFKFGVFPNILKKFQVNEAILALKLSFLDDFSFSYMLPAIAYMLISLFMVFFTKNVNEKMKTFKPSIYNLIFTAILFIWCLTSFSGISTFIYYNF